MPSPTKSNVYFFFETRITLKERSSLKKFIASLFKREKCRLANINYIFCADQRLLEINKQYLKHDFYTDIITFGLSAPSEPIQGEIYISTDRVRDNARVLEEPISRELLRVIFHGALHLCGYGDKTKKEKELMRAKEDLYLKKFKAI